MPGGRGYIPQGGDNEKNHQHPDEGHRVARRHTEQQTVIARASTQDAADQTCPPPRASASAT